jgi:hypothetical protein
METTLQNEVLAVETHAGRVWSLLILPALLGPALSVAFYPTSPARFALVIVLVVGIPALALILGGFEYRFLRHGVEVRTLGIRLQSIPRQGIVSYSIEPWAMSRGGYGIRAMGTTRAYVWGKKVVHIKTTNGDVFLGHDEPEKIVRELDQLTGVVSRG